MRTLDNIAVDITGITQHEINRIIKVLCIESVGSYDGIENGIRIYGINSVQLDYIRNKILKRK